MVENPPASAEDVKDVGSITELGRFSGGAPSNPLQLSCLGIPMDRGAWQATVHRVEKSQIQLSSMHSSVSRQILYH